MKVTVDTDERTIALSEDGSVKSVDLYSRDGFALLSNLWLKVGWNQKYTYGFSWMGRPIIQLPEDLIRIQEVIWSVRPEVIVETGVAHGGSLVFYASLLSQFGKGKVIGVDLEVRPHNRVAIEEHPLSGWIRLIEGSSTDDEVFERVKEEVGDARALVLLDSNHSKGHVRRELELYASLVAEGSYIVATDGIMAMLGDVPRGRPEWVEDNPQAAALDFASQHPDFFLEDPRGPFDETLGRVTVSHWPNAYLRRAVSTARSS